jgi:hypothetical protein
MNTKSPFNYQGLSAYVKQGVTHQEGLDANPFVDLGIRYAHAFNDRWAFKINLTYLNATDWTANDESHLITNQDIPNKDELLALPRNHPSYNAVNVYGDEVVVNLDLNGDGNPVPVSRTGIRESDIVDYKINNFQAQGALHYRINNSLEAIYDFRYAQADAIIRYENFYPFDNFKTQFHKLELRGDNFFARTYLAQSQSGDAYSMISAGINIQEGMKSTPSWAQDYQAAYQGKVFGVEAGNHDAARAFADRDIPGPESPLFQNLRDRTLDIPIDEPGGSAVINNARFFHAEGNYDLSPHLGNVIDLQTGASLRRFRLKSDGHVYNDGPQGFAEPIYVLEYGIYAQAGIHGRGWHRHQPAAAGQSSIPATGADHDL